MTKFRIDNASPDAGRDASADAPRIGVYVCHCGGNISDVVDVERVAQAASHLPNVVVARHNAAMCSQIGQNLITDDIRNEKLDRVVVAACSPSLHEHTFRAAVARAEQNPYLYEHVNIREQVSWCSKSDADGATDKATRLVAAGVAKTRFLQPLVPIAMEVTRHVTVVGGGISGLRAARDLARAGLTVTLVEKEPFLGGHVAQWNRVYPTEDNARDLVRNLLNEVGDDPLITIHTHAEIVKASGYAGNFHLELQVRPREVADPKRIAIQTGAIVLATGFDLYQPGKGEFGYEEHPGVITLAQLENMLDPEGPTGGRLECNGRPVKNICLIHCVGSRQIEGIHQPGPDGKLNEYCSRVCCTATLRAACELRQRFPQTNVFELYRDIRTYGRGHEEYYDEASRQGVLFFRYEAEHLPIVSRSEKSSGESSSESDGFPLSVQVKDTLTFGEELEIPADMVVLATGMVPRDIHTLIDELKLSRSADGFLQEVHPKLRPVELAVSGVFVAGTCQAPMDIGESCAAGSAAAVKAAALLATGRIELSPFRAQVDLDICSGEGKCVEACRHQKAVTIVETDRDDRKIRHAEVNAALCSGCGICAAVCPTGAIQADGWRLEQFNAMVDALVADYSQTEAGHV